MVNRYLTAEEAGYIVDDCGAKALIASARLGLPGESAAWPAIGIRVARGRGRGCRRQP